VLSGVGVAHAQSEVRCGGAIKPGKEFIDQWQLGCKYTFESTGREFVKLTIDGAKPFPELHLVAPNGGAIPMESWTTFSKKKELAAELQQAGQYTLSVQSRNERALRWIVSMEMRDSPYRQPPRIAAMRRGCVGGFLKTTDEQVRATDPNYGCRFTYLGKRGDLLTIRVDSQQIDPNVTLSMGGTRLGFNDDAATDNSNSLIQDQKLTVDGKYEILVNASEGKAGTFTLSVKNTAGP
jgi:hypothetical protein